ncbi:MAG: hypothetical protein JO042_06285 [Sinobacteraceae bacterium]|nr:hypothetical protein [Nevskiaceae bacterium]
MSDIFKPVEAPAAAMTAGPPLSVNLEAAGSNRTLSLGTNGADRRAPDKSGGVADRPAAGAGAGTAAGD